MAKCAVYNFSSAVHLADKCLLLIALDYGWSLSSRITDAQPKRNVEYVVVTVFGRG